MLTSAVTTERGISRALRAAAERPFPAGERKLMRPCSRVKSVTMLKRSECFTVSMTIPVIFSIITVITGQIWPAAAKLMKMRVKEKRNHRL